MDFSYLLNKRVRVLSDTTKAPNDFGILTSISKGRYPYIIRFDSGSEYGVGEIAEIIICPHCHKEKEGISTGICNHCGKFGK